jgi:hypothetical protein
LKDRRKTACKIEGKPAQVDVPANVPGDIELDTSGGHLVVIEQDIASQLIDFVKIMNVRLHVNCSPWGEIETPVESVIDESDFPGLNNAHVIPSAINEARIHDGYPFACLSA